MKIPFNIPYFSKKSNLYLDDVIKSNSFSGNQKYSQLCQNWFCEKIGSKMAVATPSCTSALEMALLLINIKPGDEVILPSYTFSSTATAVVIFGGIPVFVDVNPSNMNINENLIENAITDKTIAIMPVHYAGVSCNMEKIVDIAKKHNLFVIEDSAQCIGAKYNDKYIGNMGDLSAFSFHETKNIQCGEGGMLCINNENLIEKAHILRDKGTNRQSFLNGMVDKYSWIDKGSSYLMSEFQAAILYPQLLECEKITNTRYKLFLHYYNELKEFCIMNNFIMPEFPNNGHIFYIIVNSKNQRDNIINHMKNNDFICTSHYVALHSSIAGGKFTKYIGDMNVSNNYSERLIRFPMYYSLTQSEQNIIIKHFKNFINS